MNKRIISFIIAVVVLLMASVFAAPIVLETIFTDRIDESQVTDESLKVSKNTALQMFVAERKEGVDIQEQSEKYAYFIGVLCPTTEEKAYVDDLIANGYDALAVIEIFEFWLDTSEDINIVEKVYSYKREEPDVKFWIDAAFLDLSAKGETKNTFTELSYDEVKEYYDEGIALSDVLLADRMSRRGKNVETIVEDVKNGRSWYEIADEVYGISVSESERTLYSAIEDGEEIMSCIELARRTGESPKMYLEAIIQGGSAVEQKAELDGVQLTDAKTQLESQGLIIESVSEKEVEEQ